MFLFAVKILPFEIFNQFSQIFTQILAKFWKPKVVEKVLRLTRNWPQKGLNSKVCRLYKLLRISKSWRLASPAIW